MSANPPNILLANFFPAVHTASLPPPCSDDQPPGSASAVASNLLKSLATQFADRRLFVFLFNHHYDTEAAAEKVFAALAGSLPPPDPLGEGEGESADETGREMTALSPVTYFLQVCVLLCVFV